MRSRTLWILGAVALLAAGLRLPFLAAGMSVDEGGYAYVAREWAHGGHLYGQLWVDRPQGLMLAYRGLLAIADTSWAVRLGAVAAGALTTFFVGVIGLLLRDRATGIAAAAVYAVVGVGPHMEGFTFNGELAAAVPTTAAIAVALYWRRRRAPWLLVAAGALAAIAVLMKQSGFDGLAVVLCLAAFSAAATRGERARRTGLVVAGAAVPLGAAIIHGASLGWADYWHALVGWRVSGEQHAAQGRPDAFAHSIKTVWGDLVVLVPVALAGVVVVVRRGGVQRLAAVWLLVAFAGFNVGGLYWPHYWVQLIAPLSVLAALGATALRTRQAAALAAAAVVPVIVTLVSWAVLSPVARQRAVPYAGEFARDRAIAQFMRAHTTPGDTIYALSAQGDIYFVAHRHSAERYLWAHPLKEIADGLPGLRAKLAGPRRPKLVVVLRKPRRVDHSGRLGQVLRRNYRFRWQVPGTRWYVLESRTS